MAHFGRMDMLPLYRCFMVNHHIGPFRLPLIGSFIFNQSELIKVSRLAAPPYILQ